MENSNLFLTKNNFCKILKKIIFLENHAVETLS